jgi:hypothetical protein
MMCDESLIAQESSFRKHFLTIGIASSFKDGDENYNAGLNFALFRRFHIETVIGIRPPAPRTYSATTGVEYDIIQIKKHRAKISYSFGFFIRESSLLFDTRYIKHSVGIGYQFLLVKRLGMGIDYNPVGFYRGSRKDFVEGGTPSATEAGEVKLKLLYTF